MIILNNNLIYKQTAIEILEELKNLDYERYIRMQYSLLNENQWDTIISAFKEMLTDVLPEQESGWINCKDRMPEDLKKVLFYNDSKEICCGFYNSDYNWWQSGSGVIKDSFVTHWMFLPPPPLEKNE